MLTMCSTKNWRIGTELKTRVTAPDGWKIVGADFDGQELQIASIYSDKWEGGYVGCSPFGFNVLSGSKENGTDSSIFNLLSYISIEYNINMTKRLN
jgi:DNA polymerase gamma 1